MPNMTIPPSSPVHEDARSPGGEIGMLSRSKFQHAGAEHGNFTPKIILFDGNPCLLSQMSFHPLSFFRLSLLAPTARDRCVRRGSAAGASALCREARADDWRGREAGGATRRGSEGRQMEPW